MYALTRNNVLLRVRNIVAAADGNTDRSQGTRVQDVGQIIGKDTFLFVIFKKQFINSIFIVFSVLDFNGYSGEDNRWNRQPKEKAGMDRVY